MFLRMDLIELFQCLRHKRLIESAETFAKPLDPELILSNNDLSLYDDTLNIDGTVNTLYPKVTLSVEFPDETIKEFEVLVNPRCVHSLPLKQGEWPSGKYTVSVYDEKITDATESFELSHEENVIPFDGDQTKKVQEKYVIVDAITQIIQLDSTILKQLMNSLQKANLVP